MESPPDPVHTEHLLCSWGPLEDGAPELSPRLCPQQARNTCLWEMGKTETLSCPGAQVKGGLSLAETGDRRRQRWLLGCIWGSPSWSHPLGSRRKTGSNSPDHEKPCQPHPDSHPEVWPYLPREGALPWAGTDLGFMPQVPARAGQSCLGGGSGLRGKGRIKKDGKRLKCWKKRESEGGKEGQRAGLAAQGPSSLKGPVWRPHLDSQPTPDLSPPGAVQVSPGQETGAKTQSGVARVGGEFSMPGSTQDGNPRGP